MFDIYRRITRTKCIFLNSKSRGVTLSMKLSKNNLLMRNFPRFSPMRREILRQQIPRVRKLSSVPNQEETAICSLIFRMIPIVRFVRRQKKNTRQVWNKKSEARGRDCTVYKIRRHYHDRSQNSERGECVERWTQKRSSRPR